MSSRFSIPRFIICAKVADIVVLGRPGEGAVVGALQDAQHALRMAAGEWALEVLVDRLAHLAEGRRRNQIAGAG